MKKIHYSSPDAYVDIYEMCYALLSESSDISTDSSLEDFIDNGDMISW